MSTEHLPPAPQGPPPQPPFSPQPQPQHQQQPPQFAHPQSQNQPQFAQPQYPPQQPPQASRPASVVGIILGGVVLAVGLGIPVLPYLLFLVGGGGDTVAFEEFARSFLVTGVVVIVLGIAAIALAAILAARRGAGAARILGAIALVLAVLLPPVGLILGYVARSRGKRDGQPTGLALAVIIVGWLGTAFWVLTSIPWLFWVMSPLLS